MAVRGIKASRYNTAIPLPGETLALYNGATGALERLSPKVSAAYECVVDERARRIDRASKDFLLNRGFVVDEAVDEVEAIRMVFQESRSTLYSPHLTIAPTLDCNFGCAYCFETHRRGFMTDANQASLLEFASRLLRAPNTPPDLSIDWFGGEPLMALPVIRKLTAGFRALVDSGVARSYRASIITNGWMANAETVRELLDLGVNHAQITLDGERTLHDSRRVLKSKGGPTFDRIINNLRQMPKRMRVTIRVNTDRRNMHSIPTLFQQLAGAGVLDRVMVNVAPVEPFREHEALEDQHELKPEEFSALIEQLATRAEAESWPLYVPRPRTTIHGYCQVDRINSFVVSPTGELMKCWAELGNSPHVVGRLSDPISWTAIVPTDLSHRDPFDDPECVECNVLPLCMGSCPIVRRHRRVFGRKQCPSIKYGLPDMLARQLRADDGRGSGGKT